LREALTHYLDITNLLSQKLLALLAQQASDESEKIRLKNLANVIKFMTIKYKIISSNNF
jgi:hypothetical protein